MIEVYSCLIQNWVWATYGTTHYFSPAEDKQIDLGYYLTNEDAIQASNNYCKANAGFQSVSINKIFFTKDRLEALGYIL